MDTCDEKNAKPVTSDAAVAKRAYKRPELIDFGDVRALTLGGAGTSPDGFGLKRLVKP